MMLAFLTQPWVQRLGWTLVHFLWQGTIVSILYTAIRGLFGRWLSAQRRYVLACLALGTMTAAPPLTCLLIAKEAATTPVVSWTIPLSEWQPLLPGVVAVWLLGVVAFSIRLLAGWRFTARLRSVSHPAPVEWQRTLESIAIRVGASRPVRLLVSSLVEVPTVIGWLRPVILVPIESLTGLPIEHITALMAHELAHIRRHDYLAGILQNIAEALLFYHPAVWWVSEQIRTERELCCDDLAVAVSGDVLTYARALEELEAQRSPRLSPALAANGGSLVNRVRRLIEPSHRATDNLPGPGTVVAMSLLWIAGVGVVTAHSAQSPAKAVAPSPVAAAASSVRKAILYDPLLQAQQIPNPLPTTNTPPAPAEQAKTRIEGRVLTQAGEPIPRANVLLTEGTSLFGRPLHSENTDAAGAFVFDDIEPGTYILKVVKAGFVNGAYGSQPAEAPPLPFTLKVGRSLKDVVVKLTPQAAMTGQVTDQDGEPAEGVEVIAYKSRYVGGSKSLWQVNRTLSDDEGWFRLARLDPGRYYVSAAPVSRATSARTTADLKTLYPTPLDVTSGARLTAIDIRLRRERVYSIKGQVKRNGSPADAWVRVLTKDASAPRWSAPTSKGVFELQGLPAGRYTLEARVVDEKTIVITHNASPPPRKEPTFTGRADVIVDGSNLDSVIIALEPDLELSGIFRAEEGSLEDLAQSATPPEPPVDPVESTLLAFVSMQAGPRNAKLSPMVDLVPEDASETRNAAVMREDGTFRISRPRFVPGSYLWEVRNLSDSIYVKSALYDGVDVTRSPINIVPGGKLEFVLSGKAGRISGVLPLSAVTVTAWPKIPNPASPSSGARSRITDQNGAFTIGSLAPGDYYVAAWGGEAINSGLIVDPDFLSSFTADAATVTVAEGGVAGVDVKLVPRAKIDAAADHR